MKYRLQKRRPDVTDERLAEIQAAFDALPEDAFEYGNLAHYAFYSALRNEAFTGFWQAADRDCIIGERVGANDSEISNSSWQTTEAKRYLDNVLTPHWTKDGVRINP